MPMSEQQFRRLWAGVGEMLWNQIVADGTPAVSQAPAAAGVPQPAQQQRDQSSTTQGSAERAWAPTQRAPAPARAFGFAPAGMGGFDWDAHNHSAHTPCVRSLCPGYEQTPGS